MFTENDTRYIFLSPHLDDAVFSCGGIIWEQVHKGFDIEVWTFSTMDPEMNLLSPYAQMLHSRWKNIKNPYLLRREEDKEACSILGCKWSHLDFPDCIYRFDRVTGNPLVQKDDDLFPVNFVPDQLFIYNMTRCLEGKMIFQDNLSLQTKKTQFIVPLGVGRHIDHQNTRLAAMQLGLSNYYYADFPYAAKDPSNVIAFLPENVEPEVQEITEAGVEAWLMAIACYRSQISSFWASEGEMDIAVRQYASLPIARTLWRKIS